MIALVPRFWVVLGLLVVWALVFAAITPVRQAYLNGLIDSEQTRDGALVRLAVRVERRRSSIQPLLGRAADVWSYPMSYAIGAAIQALALPFVWLARRERAPSDRIE